LLLPIVSKSNKYTILFYYFIEWCKFSLKFSLSNVVCDNGLIKIADRNFELFFFLEFSPWISRLFYDSFRWNILINFLRCPFPLFYFVVCVTVDAFGQVFFSHSIVVGFRWKVSYFSKNISSNLSRWITDQFQETLSQQMRHYPNPQMYQLITKHDTENWESLALECVRSVRLTLALITNKHTMEIRIQSSWFY
jgi:hypothetical protein